MLWLITDLWVVSALIVLEYCEMISFGYFTTIPLSKTHLTVTLSSCYHHATLILIRKLLGDIEAMSSDNQHLILQKVRCSTMYHSESGLYV